MDWGRSNRGGPLVVLSLTRRSGEKLVGHPRDPGRARTGEAWSLSFNSASDVCVDLALVYCAGSAAGKLAGGLVRAGVFFHHVLRAHPARGATDARLLW